MRAGENFLALYSENNNPRHHHGGPTSKPIRHGDGVAHGSTRHPLADYKNLRPLSPGRQHPTAQDKKSNNFMITKLELQSLTIKIEQISKPLGHHCQLLTASKSLPALTINPLQLISAETDQIAG
jgi:hypothetical protein